MKNEYIREFLHLARQEEPMFANDTIALVPREYYGYSRQIGCDHTFIFDIVQKATGRIAGEIALRIGDSAEQFYLGHIGYHVDPLYRGQAYAAQACVLCASTFAYFSMRSVVITTDPTNVPSVKTCEKLGCELECTVAVPEKVIHKLEISTLKRRYIWTLSR